MRGTATASRLVDGSGAARRCGARGYGRLRDHVAAGSRGGAAARVVNPAHAVRRAAGRLAKTDRLDAETDRPLRGGGASRAATAGERGSAGTRGDGRPPTPAGRDDRHGAQPPPHCAQPQGTQGPCGTSRHSRPRSPPSTGRSRTRSAARRPGAPPRTCSPRYRASADHRPHADRRVDRAGQHRPPPPRRPGRGNAGRPQLRRDARPPRHRRRPRGRAPRVVHGRRHRNPLEPAHPRPLSPA